MISRARLEAAAREALSLLQPMLTRLFGRRVGCTLFLFTYDRGGTVYISTAVREDMIEIVKLWLAAQEAGLTTDPVGPKGSA